MPRKLTLEEIINAINSSDPFCLTYLHDELKLLEPSIEIVRCLVESNATLLTTPNESGSIALHIACGNIENISPELLAYLIEYSLSLGGSLATTNRYGLLPIHKAVVAFTNKNSLLKIKTLIEGNPSCLLARSLDGQLPLHIALNCPKLYTVTLIDLLVELEPKALKVADKYGHYPLHKAAGKTRIDAGIVGILLEGAPEVATLKDRNGWLPLHWALSRDAPNLEVVYQLVGAYPEALFDADYEERLPFDKLMQRTKLVGKEVRPEVLALMEFTREQINSRLPKPDNVPSPNLR